MCPTEDRVVVGCASTAAAFEYALFHGQCTCFSPSSDLPGGNGAVGCQGTAEDPGVPGRVWVANSGANAISLFSVTGSAPQVLWAGTGAAGWQDGPQAQALFNNPYHLAWCSGVLYVADYGNNRLRAIAGGVVRTAGELPLLRKCKPRSVTCSRSVLRSRK